MVVLGVVALVGEHAARVKVACRLTHRLGKLRRVSPQRVACGDLTRPSARDHTANQVGGRVKHRRELGPRRMQSLLQAHATLEVHRCVPRLQTRRVDGDGAIARRFDQAEAPSAIEARRQQPSKSPLFISFCSAYHSVE